MDTDLQPGHLRAWKEALQANVAELEARIRPLLADMEKTRKQIDLLDRLLGLESDMPVEMAVPASRPRLDSGSPVADVLAQVLKQAGGPLHVTEIMRRFMDLGFAVPGRGTESNLISYLARDPRFARVSRGTYALTLGNSLQSRRTPTKRKKRAKRKQKRG